ncbi:MAG: NUDIX hydrolase [Planctomycetes bacterium]|nr:NUDIX hydrolase [Planctomycetota bacterium]
MPLPRPQIQLSVDCILLFLDGHTLRTLLIRRPIPPHLGTWALPGGFVRPDESLEAAAARVLAVETGVRDVYLEQLYTFGDPGRDPRGRVVTAAYIALVRPPAPEPREGAWTPMDALPDLAFDHLTILDYARQRLKYKLEYSPVGFRLLPEEFTLKRVQDAYEAILGRALDKRNFRKKLLSLKVLKPLAKFVREGPHRPARLYRFEEEKWERLKEKGNVFVF